VVAIAAAYSRAVERTGGWLAAGLAVLLCGTLLRLAARPMDVAAVSAALLAALLWLGIWAVGLAVTTPRAALAIGVLAMALLDLAALPPRTLVDYDRREALYRPDQALGVPVAPGTTELVLLLEPVFAGGQPRFDLVGWSCPWQSGARYYALPVQAGTGEVNLQLSGSPDREREYLLVYLPPSTAHDGDALRCR
jgi:hypothetical protein